MVKKGEAVGIIVHDLKKALQMFEGEEVSVSITLKHEVTPAQTEGVVG